MKSAKNVRELIKRVRYKSSDEMHMRTLHDALDAYAKPRKVEGASTHSNIWRTIMKSQFTRYSTAAVVLVAVLFILLNPFGALNRDGVTLADVAEKLERIKSVVIRGPRTYTSLEDPNDVSVIDMTKCYSVQYGYAEKAYEDGELIYHWSANFQKKQVTIVIPYWQRYLRFPLTDDQLEMLERLSITTSLSFFIESGFIESCKSLGSDLIDGIEVEGFEIEDLAFIRVIPKVLINVKSFSGRMWVDAGGLLPVETETEGVLGKCLFTGFEEMHVHEANRFEGYDTDLDEEIFSPVIPDGYMRIDFGALPAS